MFVIGCLTCYTRDTVNPVNGKTMNDLYMDTVQKAEYLRQQDYHLVSVWECQIHRELVEDDAMREYFEQHEAVDPLEPRDAFYGGRTNAIKLYHVCEEGEKIRYGYRDGGPPWVQSHFLFFP